MLQSESAKKSLQKRRLWFYPIGITGFEPTTNHSNHSNFVLQLSELNPKTTTQQFFQFKFFLSVKQTLKTCPSNKKPRTIITINILRIFHSILPKQRIKTKTKIKKERQITILRNFFQKAKVIMSIFVKVSLRSRHRKSIFDQN